jgi:hypothetical protein
VTKVVADNGAEFVAQMGTDAEKWAAAFVRTLGRQGIHMGLAAPGKPLDPAPGELVFGWFANAIEAGRSAGYAEGREAGTVRARLRWKLWVATDPVRIRARMKRVHAEFWMAKRLPSWLRRVVVVQSAVEAVDARERDPERRQGYDGPDDLGYRELYHAAERSRVPR